MTSPARRPGRLTPGMIIFLEAAIVFAGAPFAEPVAAAAAHSAVPAGFELVWSDEFDGHELDESRWTHRGAGRRRGGIISADNSFVDGDGHLVIETRKLGDDYHSGMIGTQRSFQIRYGYFEARMKFPVHGGQVSAFWLQSPDNNGDGGPPESTGVEIDAIVFYRGRLGGRATNGLHWGGYGENHQKKNHREIFSDGGDWHTFGVLWTENGYTFYRDGRETWQTSIAVSHVPEYLILSLVVGQRSNALERAELPDRLLVDYVRVYAAAESRLQSEGNP